MKLISKKTAGLLILMSLTFGLTSFSCKADNSSASTSMNAAYAAPAKAAVSIPEGSLSVVEALQSTFRSISSGVLPAVVEVDVTEKTKVKTFNPFRDIPFFNFGEPEGKGNDEDSYREYTQSGLGSGVIVRRNGKTNYVLTNNHVAGKADSIKIKLYDGREFDGKLVGSDQRMDIALVSFESDDKAITVAKLGDSDQVQTGDICMALGSPLGYFGSVTQGIVSATGRSGSGIGSISDFIQTDAAINQGNSGGPLVNIYGEVIGINTWIASSSGGSVGLGFSIPINNVKKAIDQFISKGKIEYGWLGVSLVSVKDEYKKELGIANQKGAFAGQVLIGSPADKAGIKAGDFIIEMNGKAVDDVDALVAKVGKIPAGETADFVVLRNGKKVSLSAKIEPRDEEVANSSSKWWPGFIASPITEDVRKQLDLGKSVKGVVVSNVLEKSPAASLRLQAGDIITAVNDKTVTSVAEFYDALDIKNNKEIWFDLYSEGHTISTGRYKVGK